jgi:membrane protein YqaA with SNARE-associated domain
MKRKMATIEGETPPPAVRGGPGAGPVRKVLFVLFIIAFLAVAVWLATIEFEGAFETFVVRYGYVGYFISACIAGINILVPTTHLIFTAPLLNAGLNPWVLVGCGALGATLADGVGYLIGSSGRATFADPLARVAYWLGRAVGKRPRLAPFMLFLWAAFMPLPNEVLVIPAGVLGYGVIRTGTITFLGNIVFNIMAVVLGLAFI